MIMFYDDGDETAREAICTEELNVSNVTHFNPDAASSI